MRPNSCLKLGSCCRNVSYLVGQWGLQRARCQGTEFYQCSKVNDFLPFAPHFFISKTANQNSLHAFRQMYCIPVWPAQGERVWDQLVMPAIGAGIYHSVNIF